MGWLSQFWAINFHHQNTWFKKMDQHTGCFHAMPCLKTRPVPWANTELTTDPVFSIDSEAIPRSGVHFPAQKNTAAQRSQLGSPNVKEAWRPVAMKVSFEGWFVPETNRNQQKPAETAPWDYGSEVEAIVNSLPTAIPICLGSKISKSAVGEILVISRHLHVHVVAEDGWAAIGRNRPQELDVIRSHLRPDPTSAMRKLWVNPPWLKSPSWIHTQTTITPWVCEPLLELWPPLNMAVWIVVIKRLKIIQKWSRHQNMARN